MQFELKRKPQDITYVTKRRKYSDTSTRGDLQTTKKPLVSSDMFLSLTLSGLNQLHIINVSTQLHFTKVINT